MRHTLLGLCAAFLAGLGTASAQVKAFDLPAMVATADGAVRGQITAARVLRVDGARDGDELYYTRLTIVGRSLADGRPLSVDVSFRGGFLGATEGVFNSEAPAADDVAVGRSVVAFYRWADDMGGGYASNALVAAHGGLYRTVEGPRGAAVLGRGAGYAIAANVRAADLESAALRLYLQKPRR